MPSIIEIQTTLQKLTNKKITYSAIGDVLGTGRSNISARAKSNSKVTEKEIQLLEQAYNVQLQPKKMTPETLEKVKTQMLELRDYIDTKQKDYEKKLQEIKSGTNITITNDNVTIPYYPDVVFSAGYGVEIYDDGQKEEITLDERLFRTDRGTKINPKYCELLTISGNSMYPKWEDGDRFILDKSVTKFVDGQTFAFKLNGECYIKEICLLGKRAKAIPLNKDYDEFYIEPEDELQIFGRVVPKVRL